MDDNKDRERPTDENAVNRQAPEPQHSPPRPEEQSAPEGTPARSTPAPAAHSPRTDAADQTQPAVRAEAEPRAGDTGTPLANQGAQTPPPSRQSDSTAPWIGGLILIAIGAIFLLRNVSGVGIDNWWAFFIAIPGAVVLWRAWTMYQENGQRLTSQVVGTAMGGVFPLLVAVIFIFDLDWGTVWPLFLIAAGLMALAPRAFGK